MPGGVQIEVGRCQYMHVKHILPSMGYISHMVFVPSLVLALNPKKPCKRIVLYYHDILFNGTDAANTTSTMITNGSRALGSEFVMMVVVFDDPLTETVIFGHPIEAARAQGFYFYDRKKLIVHGLPTT
ncbi:hypothetical protein MIMGU_mgv11b016570mg [Erythranthe guttata]|uniref:Dirigent protein n=1 Tax=Erythranthe guttata TaxID=4155 RepID=A0A022RI18_ERYGU|nr:hypothetical protein MIMGU_mgv11b016570mg [Erythranthe guttata]